MAVTTLEIRGKIYAYVACYKAGIEIIEVSDSLNPVLVGSINTGGWAKGVSTLDIRGIIYAFLTNENPGDLEIIKITDSIVLYPSIISTIR